MSTATTSTINASGKSSNHRAVSVVAAVLSAVAALIGFKWFYFHLMAYPGFEIPGPAFKLVLVHAILMSVWLILLIVQSALILFKKPRLHMTIGKIGAFLATAMLIAGIMLARNSANSKPPDFKLWDLAPRQFFAVPFLTIIFFVVLVGIGLWQRRKPAIHRTMMIIATLGALTAATDRITAISRLHADTFFGPLFGPFFWPIVIGVVLLALRSILMRSFDKVFAAGLAVLAVFGWFVMFIAKTGAWEKFVAMVL